MRFTRINTAYSYAFGLSFSALTRCKFAYQNERLMLGFVRICPPITNPRSYLLPLAPELSVAVRKEPSPNNRPYRAQNN
jgi:hypothetical protein